MARTFFDRLASLTLPAMLVAGVTVAGAAHGPVAAPARQEPGLRQNGTTVTKVLVDGTRLVSYEEYRTSIEPKANAAGTWLELEVDSAGFARGHFAAFTNRAAAAAYQKSQGTYVADQRPVNKAAGDRARAQQAKARQQFLNGKPVDLATCYTYTYAYMYDLISCGGGSYISMVTQDIIYNMGTYGWNDKISSVSMGSCIYQLKLFADTNLTGSNTTYFGPGTVEAITLSNQVSSASTPGTRC